MKKLESKKRNNPFGFGLGLDDPGLRSLLATAVLLVAVATCILFILLAAIWETKSFGMDFGVYWRVANGPANLAYEHRATLNFPYPPTMLLWISPLALIPKWPAYALWVVISISVLAASCRTHLDRKALLLALIAPPVTYCLLTGQVSVALGALILWSCSTKNRIAAGIALGVVATIKPQLVLMAPLLLLLNKDRRAFAAAVLAGVVFITLSVAVFGLESWTSWLGILGYFQHIVVKNGVLNVTITPASVAQLWHLPTLPFLLIGAGAGAWLVFACRDGAPLIQSAAIVAGSLLAAPYAVIYDLAALAPFLAWSIVRGRVIAVLAYPGGLNLLPLFATAIELAATSGKMPADRDPA